MIIVLGHNSYQKHEYDEQKCFDEWLRRADFPTSGIAMMMNIDADMDDVTVDGFGTVEYPGRMRWKMKINLGLMSKEIERIERYWSDYIGWSEDLFFEKIYDEVNELQNMYIESLAEAAEKEASDE